jgi:hypothetical protein
MKNVLQKQNLRSTLSRINIWKKPETEKVFFQQQRNEQPVIKVISLVRQQNKDSLLQKNRQQWITNVVFTSQTITLPNL